MAGTRGATRKSSGPAPKGTQKTLAFTNNKVTKASTTLPGKPSKLDILKSEDIKSEFEAATRDLGHIDSAPAIERQAKKEIQEVKRGLKEGKRSAAEVKASKVTDQQIRKFWREREEERLAPRVHMEGIRLEEKVCRFFDMSSEFGVSVIPLSMYSLVFSTRSLTLGEKLADCRIAMHRYLPNPSLDTRTETWSQSTYRGVSSVAQGRGEGQ
jgi:CRISPR/Cas system CSM-associated protein Csm2 small subunit